MKTMEERYPVKGKKINLKKKLALAWVILAVLVAAFCVKNIIAWNTYKGYQEDAMFVMCLAMERSVPEDDEGWASRCESYYDQLAPNYMPSTIKLKDYTIDNTAVNDALRNVRNAAANAFEDVFGYPSTWDVCFVFKYTEFMPYVTEKITSPYNYPSDQADLEQVLFYVSAVWFVLLLVTQILHSRRRNQTIEVEEDMVRCQLSAKKTHEIPISRIASVKRGAYKSVKIKSPGTSVSISMLKNQVEIVDAITDRMKAFTISGAPVAAAAEPVAPVADDYSQLTKLKELADLGILTQEEFEAKKKQLLGL